MPVSITGTGAITGISSLNTTVSDTELGYLDGTTSAIQTQINANLPGMQLITAQTFSGAASVSVNNCFTSTYESYFIVIGGLTAAAANNPLVRLRASGTDTTSGYTYRRAYLSGTYAGAQGSDALLYLFSNTSASGSGNYQILITAPQTATATQASVYGGGGGDAIVGAGVYTTATSFDGFSLLGNGQNITGTVRVYGMRNS